MPMLKTDSCGRYVGELAPQLEMNATLKRSAARKL